MIKFEKMNQNEIDVFIDFQKRLNKLIGFSNDVLYEDELKEYLKQELSSDAQCYIIAKENDVSIGLIAIDFSNELEFNGINYTAAIPLIYVDENKRNGILSYDLFKLALNICKKRGTLCIAFQNCTIWTTP